MSAKQQQPDQHADEVATARDTLLLELLLDVGSELSGAQLYLVRGKELRGHLACDDDGIDDQGVRHRRLPLSLLSVACRTVAQGIPYFGPVAQTDPCAALVDEETLAEHGLALLPLRLGERTVALLVGHPRRPLDRELRDVLCVLTHEAASGLGKLIAEARARRDAAARSASTKTTDPNEEGLGDDTIDDAMARAPAEELPTVRQTFDVGLGAPGSRRRRKTLSGHPGSRLAVGSQELPAPTLDEAMERAMAQPAPAIEEPAEDEPVRDEEPAAAPPEGLTDDGPVFLLTKKKRTAENELDDVYDDENFRTGTYVAPEESADDGPRGKRPSAPTLDAPGWGDAERPADSAEGSERRAHPRIPLSVEVHVQREDGNFASAFMEDISVGGIFIAMGSPPPVGELLALTFSLPSVGGEVTVRGEVRWIRPGAAQQGLAGVGLRFVGLPRETREEITRFVKDGA